MSSFAKSFPAICFMMLMPLLGNAADTIKIHLTYKHKLDDAGRTQGYSTIKQKFYTPDEILFREINYDEKTGQIASYCFYFYEGNKLNTQEWYNQKDSLLYILKHEYDASGREIRILRNEPAIGSLQIVSSIVKSYDGGGKLIKQKEYKGKKLSIQTDFDYNNSGKLARENLKFKPISQQPLKSETRIYTYNPDESLALITVNGKDKTNKHFQGSEEYSYNEKKQLSSVKVSGTDQPAGMLRTYKYLNTGALSLYQESDAAGKIRLILQYDYKKHFMDRGTQVSYFAPRK
jgi:hypothetical protein